MKVLTWLVVAVALVATVAASTSGNGDDFDAASKSYKTIAKAPLTHRARQFVDLIRAHNNKLQSRSKAFQTRLFGTEKRQTERTDRIMQQSERFGKHISKHVHNAMLNFGRAAKVAANFHVNGQSHIKYSLFKLLNIRNFEQNEVNHVLKDLDFEQVGVEVEARADGLPCTRWTTSKSRTASWCAS